MVFVVVAELEARKLSFRYPEQHRALRKHSILSGIGATGVAIEEYNEYGQFVQRVR